MLLKRSYKNRGKILKILKAGDVLVLACDTIYGIIGKVPDTNPAILSIKGRSEIKPFLQLLPDREALAATTAILPDSNILDLWPGPFTFIFSMNGGGTTAFRVPQDPSLRQLIRELGFPIYSTSVNRAGKPALNNPIEIEAEFGKELALIEDSGILIGRRPSTIVDLTVEPIRILRQGAGIVPLEFL